MKYLFLILGFCTYTYAEETMSTTEHQSLHTYNNRPSLKHAGEKRAHRLHKIDEKQALEIATHKCKDKPAKLKLTHQGTYLYYSAKAPRCTIYINAFDGSIIDPATLNMEKKQ